MQKILFLGGRYYPKASPNSICMQNIINELSDDEFEVSVLCYKDGLEDNSKAHTIKISRGLIQTMLYKSEEKKGVLNRVTVSILKLLQKMKQFLLCFGYPWCDPIVTIREIYAAERAYRIRGYDTIVAVHMPLSSLITGYVMKKRHPDIRYVAYFLDSLSGGAAPRFMEEKAYNKKALKWEEKVLSNADSIIFMESSRNYHEKAYKNTIFASKISFLDLPMLNRTLHVSRSQSETCQPIFVYVGSLASAVRSPEFFLKVFTSIDDDSWRLIFVGDDTCDMLNECAKKDKRITVIGRCTHEEAQKFEEQATVLVNLGNKNPNLTPSKVFEYMSFCKKIVSTYPIDGETSAAYLQHYPCSLLLDERGSITEAADKLRAFVAQKQTSINYKDIKQQFYSNTPEAFIHILEQ